MEFDDEEEPQTRKERKGSRHFKRRKGFRSGATAFRRVQKEIEKRKRTTGIPESRQECFTSILYHARAAALTPNLPLEGVQKLVQQYAAEPEFFLVDNSGQLQQWTIMNNEMLLTASVYSFPSYYTSGNFCSSCVMTTDFVATDTNTNSGRIRVWRRDTLDYLYTLRLRGLPYVGFKQHRTTGGNVLCAAAMEYGKATCLTIDLEKGSTTSIADPAPLQNNTAPDVIHTKHGPIMLYNTALIYGHGFEFEYRGKTIKFEDGWRCAGTSYSQVATGGEVVIFALRQNSGRGCDGWAAALFIFDCARAEFTHKLKVWSGYRCENWWGLDHCVQFVSDRSALVSCFGSLVTLIRWPELTIVQQMRLPTIGRYVMCLANGAVEGGG